VQGQAIGVKNGPPDIFLAPYDSASAFRPFVSTPGGDEGPRFSPDGKWLAYTSDESGTRELYVSALPGPGGRLQVSSGGGGEPVWAPNGKELFYRTKRHLIAAALTFSRSAVLVRRDTLFEDRFSRGFGMANYDVFPSGNEFLMVRSVAASSELGLVINWRALLSTP
jgi:hypothetical protein